MIDGYGVEMFDFATRTICTLPGIDHRADVLTRNTDGQGAIIAIGDRRAELVTGLDAARDARRRLGQRDRRVGTCLPDRFSTVTLPASLTEPTSSPGAPMAIIFGSVIGGILLAAITGAEPVAGLGPSG